MILYPSPNFNDRKDQQSVQMLVIHYTGMKSAHEAIARLTDVQAEVSAHYMIDELGNIYELVEEKYRAWHAGKSFWRGCFDVNSASIGIELCNPGHEFGYVAFPAVQVDALLELSQDIIRRHTIKPWNVVGHSDIAPLRKMDPGEFFPWAQLAMQGVGLWPEDEKFCCYIDLCSHTNDHDTLESIAYLLKCIGYDQRAIQKDQKKVLEAFCRHFCPNFFQSPFSLQQIHGKAKAVQSLIQELL